MRRVRDMIDAPSPLDSAGVDGPVRSSASVTVLIVAAALFGFAKKGRK